jgi:hypothetical protein
MIKSKKRGFKTTEIIENDIRYGFNEIISQTCPIYFLTISNTRFTEPKHLQFHIRCFFNQLRRDKEPNSIINYLSVIEFPEKVSRGNLIPDDCRIHAHIVVATDLLVSSFNNYVNTKFNNSKILDCNKDFYDLKMISDREDKERLVDYLLKQKNIFSENNYDYKIKLNRTQ